MTKSDRSNIMHTKEICTLINILFTIDMHMRHARADIEINMHNIVYILLDIF